MSKRLLLIATIGISLLCLYGYMGPKKILYPEPPGQVVIDGDMLYLDNAPYAELRYFHGGKRPRYDGIAIYYYPCDREEWIFPKEGWGYYVVEEKKKYGTIAEIEHLEREAKQKGYTVYSKNMSRDVFNPDKIICMKGNREFIKPKKMCGTMIYNIRFSEDGKYVLYELSAEEEEFCLKKYRVKYGECLEESCCQTHSKPGPYSSQKQKKR